MVEPIALWTIRLAIACYVTAVGLQIGRIRPDRLRRIAWTTGAILCVIHVVTAMAAFHGFSHADSVRHTAEVTRRVTGVDWGGGVYINYLFTLLWCVDAARQWHRPIHRTPVWIHVLMAFIVFNATAVFGPRWWKYVAAPVLVILFALATVRRQPIQADNVDSTIG